MKILSVRYHGPQRVSVAAIRVVDRRDIVRYVLPRPQTVSGLRQGESAFRARDDNCVLEVGLQEPQMFLFGDNRLGLGIAEYFIELKGPVIQLRQHGDGPDTQQRQKDGDEVGRVVQEQGNKVLLPNPPGMEL